MRGGLQPWKRASIPAESGTRSSTLKGTWDADLHPTAGSDALEAHSKASDANATRFVVSGDTITRGELSAGALRVWRNGHDPVTGEERGTPRMNADADLVLDATLNHPKSFSIAALLHPELATEFEAL